MDEKLKDSLLDNISLGGAASVENRTVEPSIASYRIREQIISVSSGLPKIKQNYLHKFDLLVNQPSALSAVSNLAIRCTLCGKVITYPAWYMRIVYSVKQIHYFVCYDAKSPTQVTARCYRR